MGKEHWSSVIADACFLCGLLFGCYPDKNLSWGQWIVATSASKKARAERDAAMAALVALAPKKTDLPSENVSGLKFVGYYIQDKFNLYSPDSFSTKKPLDMEQVGLVANIKLPDPYSSQPKDWYMVRKDEPLECLQVCFAGTELKTDLMPHFVRANQGLAQYSKTSACEIEARGMTAYKQRQILSESELDRVLAEKKLSWMLLLNSRNMQTKLARIARAGMTDLWTLTMMMMILTTPRLPLGSMLLCPSFCGLQ